MLEYFRFDLKDLQLYVYSQKCDIIYKNVDGEIMMAVSYKKLLHMMIEKDISNQDLIRKANISANIITKIRTGKYIALDKLESICLALDCTPNDVLEFIKEEK